MTIAAIGVRDHSGWAAVVALAGGAAEPRVVERRRISLLEPGMASEPFHAVAGMPADVARPHLRDSYDSAVRCARDELSKAVADLKARGFDAICIGGGVSSSPLGMPLERMLKSHPLLHASEGELFRDAIAEAAESMGLAVHRVPWKELWAQLASELGASDARERVHALGAGLGPPWTGDQKEAAAAALIALLRGHPYKTA